MNSEEMIEAISKMTEKLGVKIDFSQIDHRQFNKGRALTFGEVRKIAEVDGLVYGVFTDYEGESRRGQHGIWKAEILNNDTLMLMQGSFGLDMEFTEFGADDQSFVNDNEYYRIELFEPRPKGTRS
jgi:hypothetical protein